MEIPIIKHQPAFFLTCVFYVVCLQKRPCLLPQLFCLCFGWSQSPNHKWGYNHTPRESCSQLTKSQFNVYLSSVQNLFWLMISWGIILSNSHWGFFHNRIEESQQKATSISWHKKEGFLTIHLGIVCIYIYIYILLLLLLSYYCSKILIIILVTLGTLVQYTISQHNGMREGFCLHCLFVCCLAGPLTGLAEGFHGKERRVQGPAVFQWANYPLNEPPTESINIYGCICLVYGLYLVSNYMISIWSVNGHKKCHCMVLFLPSTMGDESNALNKQHCAAISEHAFSEC